MKKTCYLIIISFTLFLNKIYSQNFNTDEKCIQAVRNYSNYIVRILTGINFRDMHTIEVTSDLIITERHSDSSPKIIKFNFYSNYKDQYKDKKYPNAKEKTGTACVYFKNGYGVAYYDEKYLDDTHILFSNNDESTKEYKNSIERYEEFSKNRLKSNESFQYVLSKLKSYPVSTNPKNCLSVVTQNEKQYALKWYVKKSDYEPGSPYYMGDYIDFETNQFQADVDYYKNICNHNIILKGIYKNIRTKQYSENSILLKPNEKTAFFKFTPGGWHEYSKYNVQVLYDSDINQMYSENYKPTTPTVSTLTPTRTQSNEQTHTQPTTEPAKTTEDVGFTNEQLQKAIKKTEYVNAKDGQLKSDLEYTNKSIIMNELLLSKYEGKRKTKEYWKYFDENKKLLAEREEIVRKHKEDKILREKEFENKYSSSSNSKTKSNKSAINPTISPDLKSIFIKSYTGTIDNTTLNLKSKCKMSFSKNSDGSFQLNGETDKVNLVGKWDLKGKLIENNIYLFKGDIILGYEGTGFPLGTSAPITMTVSINDKSMTGKYSIQSNSKNIDAQVGVFKLY